MDVNTAFKQIAAQNWAFSEKALQMHTNIKPGKPEPLNLIPGKLPGVCWRKKHGEHELVWISSQELYESKDKSQEDRTLSSPISSIAPSGPSTAGESVCKSGSFQGPDNSSEKGKPEQTFAAA